MATAEAVRPPHILPPLKGAYVGKFRDRNPDLKAAGLVTDKASEAAAECLKEESKEISPETVKKFSQSWRPDAGQIRVFYGMADDPQLKRAKTMTHGIVYPQNTGAADLLNPTPLTLYQQRFLDRLESSTQNGKKPLGRVPDGRKNGLLPHNLDKENTVFGITLEKVGSAGEALNPDLTREEIDRQADADHYTYLVSHKSLLPGEQAQRNYADTFDPSKRYGEAMNVDYTGKGARKCMNWVSLAEKETPLIEHRLDAFRERTQPVLGLPLDPNKDTRRVGPDHVYGVLHKPDPYGVGDLLHGRAPRHYLRGDDRKRSLVAALRSQLKTAHFQQFDDLHKAFQFYDREGTGMISAEDLKAGCWKMGLPVDDSLLMQLIDFCDVNEDGFIDYQEFANFLNWRELSVKSAPAFAGKTRTDVNILSKQIDSALTHHSTTNRMYGSSVSLANQRRYRTYGVPTVRSDLPAPNQRKVSDRRSYGNEGGAGVCLNPNLFSLHGVTEFDLMQPRSLEEISSILSGSDIPVPNELINAGFVPNETGKMSLDAFRQNLTSVIAETTKCGQPVLL